MELLRFKLWPRSLDLDAIMCINCAKLEAYVAIGSLDLLTCPGIYWDTAAIQLQLDICSTNIIVMALLFVFRIYDPQASKVDSGRPPFFCS